MYRYTREVEANYTGLGGGVVSGTFYLGASDTLRVHYWQNTGGNVDTVASGVAQWFTVTKVA